MTAKDIINSKSELTALYDAGIEVSKITIKIGDECVFQKSYICCPHENKKNIEELLYSHALSNLIKNNLITI